MARKSKLLVPEARTALDKLKCEIVSSSAGKVMGPQAGQQPVNCQTNPNDVKYTVAKSLDIPLKKNEDNGELTTRQTGKIGGALGGSMVKRLVDMAKEQMETESHP